MRDSGTTHLRPLVDGLLWSEFRLEEGHNAALSIDRHTFLSL